MTRAPRRGDAAPTVVGERLRAASASAERTIAALRGHAHTGWGTIAPGIPDLAPRSSRSGRLRVPAADGTGDVLSAHWALPLRPVPDAPLVAMVHGLGGSADAVHVRRAAAGFLDAGFPVVRVNLRGAGDSAATCAGDYHAGRTDDVRTLLSATVEHLRITDGVALVGFSLGGNLILKLLGEPASTVPTPRLRAGVAVSAPVDLAAGLEHLQRSGGGVYDRFFVRRLREIVARPGADLTAEQRAAAASARTLRDFDEGITAPRGGFADAADYYTRNSAAPFLAGITVPTLVLHAADDPLVAASTYDAVDWEGLAPTVRLVLAPTGGHVGFHRLGSAVPEYVPLSVEHVRRACAVSEQQPPRSESVPGGD